jgi:hypothetical protein
MGRMTRLRILLCLLALAALAAGCGSGSKPPAAGGEASKPAKTILSDAERVASTASSVHYSGHGVQQGQKLTLDLSISSGSGADGKFALFGGTAEVIRIGPNLYIRGDRPFWRHFGSKRLGSLSERWVVVPSSLSAFQGLTGLMSISGVASKLSVQGKVVNEGVKTFQGKQVIALRVPSEKGLFYVSATGKPYPVALLGGKSSITITFDHWNQPVSIPKPPKHALNIFGG